GLAGANVVATEALLVLRDNVADVLAAKAMMCVHGDAGLGKTLSVNASLRALAPADVCRVQFRARPTPRDIRYVLFDALAISGTPPTRPIEFDALLKDALSERFRVLVCDEAQWLSRECFELWRHLWDDRRTDIAIVFVVGGDCYRVLRREAMLSSRVYVWQEFRRLDREQVLAVVPVLLDPGDDMRVSVGLLERHDPSRGRVVVHPTPGARSLQAFAHDVLGALGRAVNRLDAEQLAGPAAAWRAVTAWIVTGQI